MVNEPKFSLQIREYVGQLKLIDWLGLSIFIGVLAIAALFFLRRNSSVYITLRITDDNRLQNFWYDQTPDWYLENLDTNMESRDLLGRSILKITDIHYYPSNYLHKTVFLTLQVATAYNKTTKQYSFDGQPLLIGKDQIFTLGDIQIKGIIYKVTSESVAKPETKLYKVTGEIETEFNETVSFDAETNIEGIKKPLSQKILPGLELTDNQGRVYVTILEVDKQPGYRSFISGSKIVKAIDPEREKVEVVAEVTTELINNKHLYRSEYPLLINSQIELHGQNFTAILTVSDIEPLPSN